MSISCASRVEVFFEPCKYRRSRPRMETLETLLTKVQKLIALALAVLLIVVVILSTVDLGFLIARRDLDAAAVSHSGARPA